MTTTTTEPWPDWFTTPADAEAPIYRSVVTDHGDPLAMDAQSRAYREMGPDDTVADTDIPAMEPR